MNLHRFSRSYLRVSSWPILCLRSVSNRLRLPRFSLTTYLVDQQQVAALPVCMESLSTQAFRYKAIKAFESNGLFAAKGSGLQIHSLIECFRQQGVRQDQPGTAGNDPGYELPFGAVAISGSREITWVTADNLETKTFLANGTLCWLLKTKGPILARAYPCLRGTRLYAVDRAAIVGNG